VAGRVDHEVQGDFFFQIVGVVLAFQDSKLDIELERSRYWTPGDSDNYPRG
jgi:hypothetical protein